MKTAHPELEAMPIIAPVQAKAKGICRPNISLNNRGDCHPRRRHYGNVKAQRENDLRPYRPSTKKRTSAEQCEQKRLTNLTNADLAQNLRVLEAGALSKSEEKVAADQFAAEKIAADKEDKNHKNKRCAIERSTASNRTKSNTGATAKLTGF